MDYDRWGFVINAQNKNYQMTDYEKKLIFKPSWNKSKWLRKSKKEPHSVQLVTPKLDITNSNRIWVRNQKTKNHLENLGFNNIYVKRLILNDF